MTRDTSTAKPKNPDRGILFSGFVILVVVINLIRTAILFFARQDALEENLWFFGVSILIGILTIVAAIGMWNWKLWGLGLYIVLALIGMVISLVVTGWPLILFYDTIPLLLLGAAIGSRLDLFR